ncbi:hypothetical protein MRX96_000888 [Rhipicephalus microplus]
MAYVREWAYIQLQGQQQLGEAPQEYVSGILQLCARMNTKRPELEKHRHLLKGLRPETIEQVAITNPVACTLTIVHDRIGYARIANPDDTPLAMPKSAALGTTTPIV